MMHYSICVNTVSVPAYIQQQPERVVVSTLLQLLWCIQVFESNSWKRIVVQDFYREYFLFLVAKQIAAVAEMSLFACSLAVCCCQGRQPLAGERKVHLTCDFLSV